MSDDRVKEVKTVNLGINVDKMDENNKKVMMNALRLTEKNLSKSFGDALGESLSEATKGMSYSEMRGLYG
jgi:hypothetical protein